jgi:hypothetical protein
LTPKLSNVATEYLRHHDELEAARELFLGERARLLDELGTVMNEVAAKQKLTVSNSRRNDDTGSFVLDIDGEYVALRAAMKGTKRTSGYSIAIGSFLGYVGAQAILWWHLRVTPARKKKLELPALEKALGPNTQIVSEGPWLYIRTASIAASDVVLETLDTEIRRLPELFTTADQWLAKRFEDQATPPPPPKPEPPEAPEPSEPAESNESSTVIVSQDSP